MTSLFTNKISLANWRHNLKTRLEEFLQVVYDINILRPADELTLKFLTL